MTYAIVYIGATWCTICKTMKPSIEVLTDCYNLELRILDYDADLTEEQQADIKKVPTIRVIDSSTSAVICEWNANQVASLKDWLRNNITLE
jgi:thiol-disulfide isomerase/thioredoxin